MSEEDVTDPADAPASPAGVHRRDAATGGTSRRWFLAGGGAVLLAAGAGAGVAFAVGDQTRAPRPAPEPLVQALAAEQKLIADLDATTGGSGTVRRVIAASRRDHAAHLQALRTIAADYDPVPHAAATTSGTAGANGTARSVAELRVAEQQAAQAATSRAAALDGRAAALLASIAACEATHAALFA